MGYNNKSSGVFSYKVFWFSLCAPVVIAVILMLAIAHNDNLSLDWPSQYSLTIFLKYMEVPIWIFGSSIPFATLAAANYRAIQFQENLDFQRRNLERQELEHVVDLYHKELILFKDKFEAVVHNGKFKCIRPEDATIIYTRFFPKPKKAGDCIFKIDDVRVDYIYEIIKFVEKEAFLIEKYNEEIKVGSELELKCDLMKRLDIGLNQEEERVIINSLNIYDVKLMVLLFIIEEKLLSACHSIGIKHHSIHYFPVVTVFESFMDVVGLYCSILPEDEGYNKYRISDERRVEFGDVINHWLEYSSIQGNYSANEGYTLNDFINQLRIILVKSNM
ncbi:hypothetical protein [Pseudoalteromonas umbrosa]|uniref:hypothetical protein n=1 Tax=Pseudoalteromonas umbrosa TaxID=3048489 RepID=UPI0024C3C605|nr:hypothetical protein [Pseudoalteromonas sp. B95]MDK1285949.1 hypothetical protein [Pseudoalteromonas sp. B95]